MTATIPGTLNMVQRLFRNNVHKLNPAQALVLAMLLLRGGKATRELVAADCSLWELSHGGPDWPTLNLWADALGVESDLAEAVVRIGVGEVA